MSTVDFRIAKHLSEEFWQQTILRFLTLRMPIDLPYEISKFRSEFDDIHIVGVMDHQVVASVVVSPVDAQWARIRAVAVDPKLQGSGIGAEAMAFSEAVARERGFRAVFLHARENVVGFYERIGYTGEGEMFEEVTVSHLRMVKTLQL